MRTKHLIHVFIAAALSLNVAVAQTVKSQIIYNGGSGAYKAEIVADTTCPDFTIYRPQDIRTAIAEGGKLPVILYANGACANNNVEMRILLNEIASHGYIVAAIGPYDEGDTIEQWRRVLTSNTPKGKHIVFANGVEFKPLTEKERMESRRMPTPGNRPKRTYPGMLLEALDWFTSQNGNPDSEYYHCLDLKNVVAMGQSCGGAQVLAVAHDPRLKTCVLMNSGIGDRTMQGATKESLANLHTPTLYLIGGPEDQAHPNAELDFVRIGDDIPVVLINSNDGHNGTYYEKDGGNYAKVVLKWLNWQLKGKTEESSLFLDSEAFYNSFPTWTVERKNFSQTRDILTLDLNGNETELLSKEDKAERDSQGRITVISGTREAAVQVFFPEKNSTGAAVIICSGGAMRFHSWGNDVESMAHWLNERGITAIGLKYRLYPQIPMNQPSKSGKSSKKKHPVSQGLRITDYNLVENSNVNPDVDGVFDKFGDEAINDALAAVRLVRSRAAEWGIDPKKVGLLGYSAGGGVAIGATVRADETSMPSFLATCYGPSMIDVTVPENAPALFIATRSDHNNVAAGLLSLYLDWKKAGAKAEMYLYDDGRMGFGPDDEGGTSGMWREHFYRWLQNTIDICR